MRRMTEMLLIITLVAAGAACEKEESGPSAVPAEKEQTAPEWDDDAAWKEAKEVASDPEQTPVERINALQNYIDARPAASRPPKRLKKARAWLARLEASRLVRGAHIHAVDELDEAMVTWQMAKKLGGDDLRDVGEAIAFEIVRNTAEHGHSQRLDEPVVFEGLDDAQKYTVSHVAFGGLGWTRGTVARATKRAALFIAPAEERERWSNANWTLWTRNLAANALLDEHLGGPLFDTEHPGKLNRGAAKKLNAALRKNIGKPILGAPFDAAIHMYEPRLRQYEAAHEALENVGRRQVLKDYREAYGQYVEGTDPARPNHQMMRFYHDWTKDHAIAKKTGTDAYTVAFAVGFWMRRMNDGTDRMFHATLNRILDRL